MTDKFIYRESPSQTAGPYLHIGCTPNQAGVEGIYDQDLGVERQSGGDNQLLDLTIRVFDGQDELVADAMIELWIAEKQYWARRVLDNESGSFAFEIPKPLSSTDTEGRFHAAHASLWIVARGINLGLHTRLYFPDEDNKEDFALGLIPESRSRTLIAEKLETGYAFDIYLQGDRETVFFDV